MRWEMMFELLKLGLFVLLFFRETLTKAGMTVALLVAALTPNPSLERHAQTPTREDEDTAKGLEVVGIEVGVGVGLPKASMSRRLGVMGEKHMASPKSNDVSDSSGSRSGSASG